ncbi:MAG: FAD-binding protein [Caulobacteraceae bacterium]|nr:FAD-binding protein [Caulobacteraceae bacterium]
MTTWRNWSGSVVARPSAIAHPRTIKDLQTLVREAPKVRVAGSGHSFMPLCATDGLLLGLEHMEGEVEVSPDYDYVWVPAGMPIHRLTEFLWEQGLSLANQGDVDRQAIAGALATGTHGTGRALGSLSTQARGFDLVLADGSIVRCDPDNDPDLFEAQRVSLGALGVVWRIKLAVLPGYRLRETLQPMRLEEILEAWPDLVHRHRHVEFFVFPYARRALLKTLDAVNEGDDRPHPSWLETTILEAVCDLSAGVPALTPTLQRLLSLGLSGSVRAAPAHVIFPSERPTRFEEMEGEIPAADGLEALRAAISEVRLRRFPISFPLEYRVVAADDIWLSPMCGRECASISFHQYASAPWREAFAAVEAVFRDAGGRPHWAKRHSLASEDVLRLYPMARRWGEVRRRVDPQGKFLNPHLRDLLAFSVEGAPTPMAA